MDGYVRSLRAMGNSCTKHPGYRPCREARPGPHGTPDVMGFHTPPRSRTTGRTRSLSPAGPDVRSVGLLDAAVAPLPGVAWSATCKDPGTEGAAARTSWLPATTSRGTARSGPRPMARRGPTPGRTSPGSSTPTGSAGRTTWGPGPAWSRRARAGRRGHGRCAEPAARVPHRAVDHQLHNVSPNSAFFNAAAAGTLPAVSWVVPTTHKGEHPPDSIGNGQAWVTHVVNAVMRGPPSSGSTRRSS